MAKEVVLVPREKYQKLLEGREMTLKNQSETYNLKTDEDFEEKKKGSASTKTLTKKVICRTIRTQTPTRNMKI